MTIRTRCDVPIHQVDEIVYCDRHERVHERRAIEYAYDDERGPLRCNADSWRPVFTADSPRGLDVAQMRTEPPS